jgi:cardiolipin synthase
MEAEGSPLYKNNKAKYYRMGEDAFDDMFADIAKAKKFVLIDFYIVAEGALWDQLHAILLDLIHQGVEVKFLYDDFGAVLRVGKYFARDLIAEGFEVQVFNPIHKYMHKLFMNYRSHQKIVVIDGNIGYTGGFNIADEYANLIDRFGVWKDTGIRLKGDAVWGLTVIFMQMWHVCSNDELNLDAYRPDKAFPENRVYCHTLTDGPANNPKNLIETVYKQMIHFAGEKLYIMTPYLVLEESMIQALIESARRGVDVRIITPSIPDKKRVKWLTEYNYGILLLHGIRIFEYLPGFLHAKVIMNEHCAIVGTINMDYRSFYLHYENGVWIYDTEIIKDIHGDFDDTFQESREISYAEWLSRPWQLKIGQNILNVFSTLV